jgi:plasmid stability protein
MANLTIRNVDDDIVEALKARAKSHNRSLESEIRQILVDQARRPSWRGAELRALAEKIAAMTPNVPQTDSVELLREDRDR